MKRVIDRVIKLIEPTPEPEPAPLSAKDQLAKDAGDYFDFLLHSYWETRVPKWMNAPEPPRGDPAMRDRHDEWVASIKGSMQRQMEHPTVDDMFLKELTQRKPIKLVKWSDPSTYHRHGASKASAGEIEE